MSATAERGGRDATNLLTGEVPGRAIMRATGSTGKDGAIFHINETRGKR
ncbi:MAG TPA: hypothetical protein VGD06_08205 [Acidobacteriota bacterium]